MLIAVRCLPAWGCPYAIVQFSDNSFEKYMHKRSRHQMITNKENMAETVRLMINGEYPCRMVEELDDDS